MTPFEQAINRNWHPVHFTIAPGTATSCPECFWGLDDEERANLSDEDAQAWDEGSFSHSQCESCNSTFGGDRFPAHAIEHHPNTHTYHIEICVDCLIYHANDDLPKEWSQNP